MTTTERSSLTARIAQYPADRYPAQHATSQFHLGSLLLQSGDTAPALTALTVAREVFGRIGMRVEHAKSAVMLGVALRAAGRPADAQQTLSTAVTELAALDQPAEQAAAAYDLALVCQDLGRLPEAYDAWSAARELFAGAGYPGQAAAAARDHGACLLTAGEPETAAPLLEQAVRLAEAAGDLPGVGAAANVLGLVRLACGDAASAVDALRAAVGAFPRTARPAEHAMTKANLALAYAEAGLAARARLAAAQTLAVPQADPAVRAQAQGIWDAMPGSLVEDLQSVLDDSPQEHWVGALREEVVRACELAPGQLDEVVRGVLDGVLRRPGDAYDVAESLLHVVVELPPREYTRVVTAVVAATAGRPAPETARLHAVFGSAMARFAMPQWQRLAVALNEAAGHAGQPQEWR